MTPCPRCNGTGAVRGHLCQHCNGSGRSPILLIGAMIIAMLCALYGLAGLATAIGQSIETYYIQ